MSLYGGGGGGRSDTEVVAGVDALEAPISAFLTVMAEDHVEAAAAVAAALDMAEVAAVSFRVMQTVTHLNLFVSKSCSLLELTLQATVVVVMVAAEAAAEVTLDRVRGR
jgi:hypothetical protein